jgi:hypothetical protein
MTLKASFSSVKDTITLIVQTGERQLKAVLDNVTNSDHDLYQKYEHARLALQSELQISVERLQGLIILCCVTQEYHRKYIRDLKDAQTICHQNWKIQDFNLVHMQKPSPFIPRREVA